MFFSRTVNDRINRLYERALRIAYNDYKILNNEYKIIIDKLEGYGKIQLRGSAKAKLKIKPALNLKEAILNQLHVVNFYKDDSVS